MRRGADRNEGRREVDLPTRPFYGFGWVSFCLKDNRFSDFPLLFYDEVMSVPAQVELRR